MVARRKATSSSSDRPLLLPQEAQLVEPEPREPGPADAGQVGPAALDPQDLDRPAGKVRFASLEGAVSAPRLGEGGVPSDQVRQVRQEVDLVDDRAGLLLVPEILHGANVITVAEQGHPS